jgi:hypothetical protein
VSQSLQRDAGKDNIRNLCYCFAAASWRANQAIKNPISQKNY